MTLHEGIRESRLSSSFQATSVRKLESPISLRFSRRVEYMWISKVRFLKWLLKLSPVVVAACWGWDPIIVEAHVSGSQIHPHTQHSLSSTSGSMLGRTVKWFAARLPSKSTWGDKSPAPFLGPVPHLYLGLNSLCSPCSITNPLSTSLMFCHLLSPSHSLVIWLTSMFPMLPPLPHHRVQSLSIVQPHLLPLVPQRLGFFFILLTTFPMSLAIWCRSSENSWAMSRKSWMDWGKERQASLRPRALYTVCRRNWQRRVAHAKPELRQGDKDGLRTKINKEKQ